ncbi:acyltransferase [Stutzerimonas degradans]|nr:acyltransferase [Stutzerimonas degradans]EKM94469.1 acyltransferase [Stutzerimonas degradans]
MAEYCIFFGQFGVAIFFIISGLVIPFSFEKCARKDFLIRRAVRIYPVYIAGFCFSMMSLYFLSKYIGVSYKFSLFDIVAHFGVITRAPLDVARIDGISWTLEVEIYFYLTMCAAGSTILGFDTRRYVLVSLMIAFFAAIVFKYYGYLVGVQVASALLFLLGLAFYGLINERISLRGLWIIQAVVCALIAVLWLGVSVRAGYTLQWMAGNLLAIVAFYCCYVLRHRFKYNPVLSHLSAISYPLYVVHALFGYAIMYVLIRNGVDVYLTIGVASIAAYMAALLIHLTVERASLLWIKRSRQKLRYGPSHIS